MFKMTALVVFLVLFQTCFKRVRSVADPDLGTTKNFIVRFHPHAIETFRSIQLDARHRTNSFVKVGSVFGMAAKLTREEVEEFNVSDDVHSIYPILQYSACQNCVHGPPSNISSPQCEFAQAWGIDRSDQRQLPLDGMYHWTADGRNVEAFILDTGINFDHPDWNPGQTALSVTCLSGMCYAVQDGDSAAHGTHVAGTIASPSFGIAKGARVSSVQVLNSEGHSNTLLVAKGIQFVFEYAKRNPAQRIVINLSLASTTDVFLNSVVEEAWQAGIVVVAAAGNDAEDACLSSPASAAGIISVGASTIGDSVPSFTNFGRCVDIFAPGHAIRSLNSNFKTEGPSLILSGTSMAAPHVAGAACLILSHSPDLTPDQVRRLLINNSLPMVQHNFANTTRGLLHISGVFDRGQFGRGFIMSQVVLASVGVLLVCLSLGGTWTCVCRKPPQSEHELLLSAHHQSSIAISGPLLPRSSRPPAPILADTPSQNQQSYQQVVVEVKEEEKFDTELDFSYQLMGDDRSSNENDDDQVLVEKRSERKQRHAGGVVKKLKNLLR